MSSRLRGCVGVPSSTINEVIDALRRRDLFDVVEGVCQSQGISVAEVASRLQTSSIVYARHLVWRAIRELPDRRLSYPEIGAIFGRNHATVMAGIRRVS